MTDGILLDTHILLWLDAGSDSLQVHTRELLDDHWQAGGAILVSAVTVWEIAMLAESGRIQLDCSTDKWIGRCLDRPGFEVIPLGWRACIRAYELRHFDHRDPADRLLIGTAIDLDCHLVTYDERIAAFARRRGRQQGLRLAV